MCYVKCALFAFIKRKTANAIIFRKTVNGWWEERLPRTWPLVGRAGMELGSGGSHGAAFQVDTCRVTSQKEGWLCEKAVVPRVGKSEG